MNLLILGGNSPHNQPWTEEVASTVGSLFERALIWPYRHWQTGSGSIDFDYEMNHLKEVAEVATLEPYVIFAKSVGVVLACRGLARGALHAHGGLFTGVPLGLVQKENLPLGQWIVDSGLREKMIFVQNDADPAGSYAAVKTYFQDNGLGDVATVELAGASHSYNDLAALTELAARFSD